MIARLEPGITPEAANRALDAAHVRLMGIWPNEYTPEGMKVTSVHEFVVRGTRPTLLALLTGVALVALIACFNAASLLLGRALRRESEFAVRVALGASTRRLSMLLLAEGLIISLASAVLGTLVAIVGVDVLLRLAPQGVPRLDQVRIDGGVLLFAGGIAVFTGLAASVLPALALLRGGISSGIRIGSRSLLGGGRHRLRGALVAAEVALAVMLVSGSSLLYGLSGGQQQRLCIARALAMQPEILLMDEPTSALDPIASSKIEDLVHKLKEDLTIIIVTHNMQQAARVADRAAFMYLGELIEYGFTKQIFQNPEQELTEKFVSGKFG
jgi:hypothetical protein